MEPDRRQQAAREVLKLCRNKIYFDLRFLEQALFRLIPEENENIYIGSNGKTLYYENMYLLNRYMQSWEDVSCDYLHIIIHCLYQHPLKAYQYEAGIWNLAADIAVTDVIGEMNLPWASGCLPAECFKITDRIKAEVKLMSATHIAGYLQRDALDVERVLGWSFEELEAMFRRDDHSCWNHKTNEDQDSRQTGPQDVSCNGSPAESRIGNQAGRQRLNIRELQCLEEEWKETAENVVLGSQHFPGRQGELPQSMVQNLQKLTRETYDYTEFLRKFAVMNERMKVNPDEFDYIYYLYGMKELKKIPLIEPLEYREEYQIREFVIAIDTSGSCSGEFVQRFLNKTYNILKQTEHFADKVVLHIIQCDARVQEDVRIDSLEKLEEYMEHMELKGFGGTDFRPVFEYVDALLSQNEFTRLCGLIYFTDGWGTFPEAAPAYKTAFIFVERDDCVRVPPWAMQLYLDHV